MGKSEIQKSLDFSLRDICVATRNWHTQTHQTQEKLQTNGDTNTPQDSSFHLIPLVQKVKRNNQEEKAQLSAQDRLDSVGLLHKLELQLTPFALLTFHQETEGWKEEDFIKETVPGTKLQVSFEILCVPSL